MIASLIFTGRHHVLFLVCLLVLYPQLCWGWQEDTNHSSVNIIQLSQEFLPIAEVSISGVIPFPVPFPSKQSQNMRMDSEEAHNDLETWDESGHFKRSNDHQTPIGGLRNFALALTQAIVTLSVEMPFFFRPLLRQ